MDRRRAIQAFNRTIERFNAPCGNGVEIDIEGGFVELKVINTGGDQFLGFLVQNFSKGHRHFRAVAIMLVGQRINDGHGPGHGELERMVSMRAGELYLVSMDRSFAAEGRDHRRAIRVIAIIADADRCFFVEIDAVDFLKDTVHEMLARLFAIRDDIDPGFFLISDR